MDAVECAVIGGGVVGLAIARALAAAGREVVVLEAADRAGTETSSRNSEVIHAGLYYGKDSLKARLCVRGRDLLYRYCKERGIEHRRLGKLVVATEKEDVPALERLLRNARANGCTEPAWLSRAEALALEPELRCEGALLSPLTGVVDTHGLIASLVAETRQLGGTIALRSPVLRGRVAGPGIELEVGGDPAWVRCRHLFNAAGLHAHRVAASIDGVPRESIPVVRYAKGSYFSTSRPVPFQRLVYPLAPAAVGLGIHLTLDVAGRARFGPDFEWVDEIDYDVDERKAPAFETSIRAFWPAMPAGALAPDTAGVRTILSSPQGPPHDFVVQTRGAHGVPGLVNLYGIDSPGLTASLALAELVAGLTE